MDMVSLTAVFLGCHAKFLWGKRWVTCQKTASKETTIWTQTAQRNAFILAGDSAHILAMARTKAH